jgi:hypothetical protein
MPTYLERLQEEFDQITAGIEATLEGAAEANRDLTDDEQGSIDRDDTRRGELEAAIKHYTEVEQRRERVDKLRGSIPAARRVERDGGGAQPDMSADVKAALEGLKILGATPGAYAYHQRRAQVERSRESIEWMERVDGLVERATAHQTTTDNPGIIPRPIVEPVVDLLKGTRRTVDSFGTKAAPAGGFDRPHVTQHVAVGKQATEKTETASQKMVIGKIPVALETFAGHVNLSKQDVRWTSPALLNIIYEDFLKVYRKVTNAAAAADLAAGATVTVIGDVTTIAGFDAWLAAADAAILTAADQSPDHLWMSLDMRTSLAQLRTPLGGKAYNLPIVGEGGDVEGLIPVVDPALPAGTLIAGIAEYGEVWEDLEGFLTVEEPNVLGQLVGYAGYLDTVVTDAGAFAKHDDGVPLAATATRRK